MASTPKGSVVGAGAKGAALVEMHRTDGRCACSAREVLQKRHNRLLNTDSSFSSYRKADVVLDGKSQKGEGGEAG